MTARLLTIVSTSVLLATSAWAQNAADESAADEDIVVVIDEPVEEGGEVDATVTDEVEPSEGAVTVTETEAPPEDEVAEAEEPAMEDPAAEEEMPVAEPTDMAADEPASADEAGTMDEAAEEEPAMAMEEEAPATDSEATEAEAGEMAATEEGEPTVTMEEPDLDLELELPEDDEIVLNLPPEEQGGSSVSRDAEKISVDFPDEEVRTIIRNVADLYDLNVVIPDTLIGNVSLKLRNVTWRQVFDVVLDQLGYTYVEEGNIIKIKSQDELAQEPVDTRVFVINFANASELNSAISPLIDPSAGGKLQVDSRSNSLIVTERPSRMSSIQEIIDRLDRPNEQVMIESKFVEVTDRDELNIGINWSSLAGYEVQAGPFTREYQQDDSTIKEGADALSGITRETTITNGGGATTTTTRFDNNVKEFIDNEGRIDTAVFSADAFQVVLSALDSNNDVELVSNPTVVTVNNTPARITIGEEFPIPSYNYNQEQGTFEVSGFDYEDIGIILDVTPQINSAGFISLRIAPEISSRTGNVNFGGAGGAEIPIITSRRTESTVIIKSGFTLAIGGLVQKETGLTENTVPVLGDMPVLGRLFRHKSNTTDARNLIIFITAKILNPDGSTYRDVFSQRRLWEMGIKTRDLPGYEPPPEEEALFTQLQRARDEIEQLRAEAKLREQIQTLNEVQLKETKDANEPEKRESIPRRNAP